jgi:hypothetical protein
LLTSIAVLLLGMVFTSRGFPPGTLGFVVMNVVTAAVIVASVLAFAVLLCFCGVPLHQGTSNSVDDCTLQIAP